MRKKWGDLIQPYKIANGLEKVENLLPSKISENSRTVINFKERLDVPVSSGDLRKSVYQVKSLTDQIIIMIKT